MYLLFDGNVSWYVDAYCIRTYYVVLEEFYGRTFSRDFLDRLETIMFVRRRPASRAAMARDE